jgi:hypothetical protein
MTLISIKLHLFIDKKCSKYQNISFMTCFIQLQCPTQLMKWLKMYLTTNGQPNDSWH